MSVVRETERISGMELPKFRRPEGSIFDGIKTKLGFNSVGYGDDYYGRGYDDDFDKEYAEEFAEYGPDYREDNSQSTYDPYAPVTVRPARTVPKLVSIDDVRARTQVPDSLNRDPLPERRVTSAASLRGDRMIVESDIPAAKNTPTARAAAARDRERSESLNALFSSTVEDTLETAAIPPVTASKPESILPANAFDPYDAYEGSGASTHTPSRTLSVFIPTSYGEVERVAKALKAGDVAILALRKTPDDLAKRILDFSFGVSSALDANVDCIASKVFAITRGAALTETELSSLRAQGVL